MGETAADADRLFQELEDLVPPAVGVEYLAKMLGTTLKGLPLDQVRPDPLHLFRTARCPRWSRMRSAARPSAKGSRPWLRRKA